MMPSRSLQWSRKTSGTFTTRQKFAATALFLALNTGCITSALWSSADEPIVPFTGIDGLARPGPGPGEFLVARYGKGDDAQLVRVPLDADGRPLAPFACGSDPTGTTAAENLPSLTAEQQLILTAAAAPSRAGRKDSTKVVPAVSPFLFASNDAVVITAYRRTPDGRVHPEALPVRNSTDKPNPLPSDVYTLMLPADCPMDPARRRLHRAQAVALTPLTLTADAAVDTAIAVPVVALIAFESWAEGGFQTPDCSQGTDDHERSGESHVTHHHHEHGRDDKGE